MTATNDKKVMTCKVCRKAKTTVCIKDYAHHTYPICSACEKTMTAFADTVKMARPMRVN